MLLRLVALVVGLFELLAPRKTVDFWFALATTDEGDAELRPWVYTAARVEGALLLLWALRSRGSGDESADD
jgi:hypothetical protein